MVVAVSMTIPVTVVVMSMRNVRVSSLFGRL
jgi:hypothetical protein